MPNWNPGATFVVAWLIFATAFGAGAYWTGRAWGALLARIERKEPNR